MASGRQLESRLLYLRKALGGALPADAFGGPFAGKLKAFCNVRHLIAHANGEPRGDAAKKSRAQIKQLGFVACATHVIVPKDAAGTILDEARQWASEACDAVEGTLGRLRPRSS